MEKELSGLKNLVDYYWTKDLFQFFAKEESHRGILKLMLALKLIFLTRLTLTFLITLRLFPRFSEIFLYIN